MINQILYGADARTSIKEGLDKVADAVKVTLGPAGRCVVISKAYPSPEGMLYPPLHVTKDGVTVARSVELFGLQRVGGKFAKEAAQKTMDEVGDGTSTTCVLLQAIVNEGLKLLDGGMNPVELKKNIEEMVVEVVRELQALAIPVDGDIEKIRQVATISANNDAAIGNLIAEAFEKIGSDGVITIEESKTADTYVSVVNGYGFDRGFISPYFINNKAKAECILENPLVLLYDKKITKMAQFGQWLETEVVKKVQPLLVICEDMEGEALATFTMNNNKAISVCVVKSPLYGELRREAMEDLAAFTGGEFISDLKGSSLASMSLKQLGRVEKVIVGKESAVLVGGKGNTEHLLNELRMTETQVTGVEKEAIQARIAKLTGGVAVLHVGAATETEMKEKKDRADDAVRATKAAVAEGIVPGSGTGYIEAMVILGDMYPFPDARYPLLAKVMQAPLAQICRNAGVVPEAVLDEVFGLPSQFGYNAKTAEYDNLVETGIIDPVRVLRCALQNAASAAVMILTSETLIADNV